MREELEKFKGKKIVVDTSTSWVYIGELKEVLKSCIVMVDVDVHDNSDVSSSKERYVLDSRRTGVKNNREEVIVNLDFIISFSPLEKVIHF